MSPALLAILSAAVALPIGGVYARHIFGKLALSAACEKAKADVAQFTKDNTALKPVTQVFKDHAAALHGMLTVYKTKRDEEMAVLRQYRIPRPQITMDLNDISEPKIDNIELFTKKMVDSGKRKLKRAILQNVQHRLREVRLHELAAGAAAAGITLTPDGLISPEDLKTMDEAFQKAYGKLMDQLKPELNTLKKEFTHIINETHIADVAAKVAEKAHDLGANLMGEEIYHHLGSFVDHLTDLYTMPVVNRAARTIWYEMESLANGETDLLHTVTEGGMAIGLKALGYSLAIATGVGMVGAIAFSIASGIANNFILDELNKDRTERYNALLAEVRELFFATQQAIAAIAQEFDDEFQRRVELYPDINAEPVLNEWLDKFVESFNRAFEKAENTAAENLQTAVSALPENNWVDAVLGIDRREAVANQYHRAHREVSNRHASTLYQFTNARDNHAIEAAEFLRDQFIFTSPEIEQLLTDMEGVSGQTEDDYTARYDIWYGETKEFQEVEGAKATDKMMGEARAYNAFKAASATQMEGLVKKINATRKRMGIKPTPQAKAA